MKCLLCGRQMQESSLSDLIFGNDLLCRKCRGEWQRKDIAFLLDGVPLDSFYVYNAAFSACLIQYKECGDEALKDVFLSQVKNRLRRRYRGFTLLMMPSTQKKTEARGFSHLKSMFECLGLPCLEPFEKTEDISQKAMGRSARQEMITAIRLKKDIQLPEKIVLCDDTVTTGATLKGALKCLDQKKHTIRICTVSYNARWITENRPSGIHCLFMRQQV